LQERWIWGGDTSAGGVKATTAMKANRARPPESVKRRRRENPPVHRGGKICTQSLGKKLGMSFRGEKKRKKEGQSGQSLERTEALGDQITTYVPGTMTSRGKGRAFPESESRLGEGTEPSFRRSAMGGRSLSRRGKRKEGRKENQASRLAI